MSDYTNKEITDFLRDANRDLGADKYSGDEMIPDYCKAVIIGQQLQAKLKELGVEIESQAHHIELLQQCDDSSTEVVGEMDKELEAKDERIKELEAKVMTDDEAKKLVRAAANVLSDAVLGIIQDDPHGWSKRPCDSCQTVSSVIGKPFGCLKYQERHK